ncbi:MAG TPA: signal peptidase I [Allosphingosinicella sp.]
MTGGRRSAWARLGIVALNLLQPGLGLLRIGRLRLALLFLFTPLLVYALLLSWYAAGPVMTLTGYAVSSILVLTVAAGLYLLSMLFSWRGSALCGSPEAWWSRWYGIAALALTAIAVSWPLPGIAHRFYEPFYMPAESMAPTLLKGDRILASMRPGKALRRGEIVILDVRGNRYVKRIAGLPGDRIAMRAGVVVLNGRPVPQRPLAVETVASAWGPAGATRLEEQFPGEPGPHQIYDMGPNDIDEMAQQTVKPGHVFVLGDNRDRSADSRVPAAMDGVEQLPVEKVRGRVLFQTWNPDGTLARPIR